MNVLCNEKEYTRTYTDKIAIFIRSGWLTTRDIQTHSEVKKTATKYSTHLRTTGGKATMTQNLKYEKKNSATTTVPILSWITFIKSDWVKNGYGQNEKYSSKYETHESKNWKKAKKVEEKEKKSRMECWRNKSSKQQQ